MCLKICAMPPAIASAKTTYRFIMLCNLYARMKKKVYVDFLEIPLFIQRITVDRYGEAQWIIQSISLQYRTVPYGTLSSVFKYIFLRFFFSSSSSVFFIVCFFFLTTKRHNVNFYTGTW